MTIGCEPINPVPYDENTCIYPRFPGLTKREYFAAKAMQGLLAAETEESHYATRGDLARTAVAQADAVLAALTSTEQGLAK